MSQTRLLIDVIQTLERSGVGYMLTGSFATSLQGEPRATHDVDLVIEVDARAVDALSATFEAERFHFDAEGARRALNEGSVFNLLDTTTGDKVDFWPLTGHAFDVSRFGRRIRVDALGCSIAVSAPEDTILQKLRWASSGGGSERHFNDALGVYELQSGALDEDYLGEWAERLGLVSELARVRERAVDLGGQV